MVSSNCCICHSEQGAEGQDWGMAAFDMDPTGDGDCNVPGPFKIGSLLGGANCTNSMNTKPAQQTLCVSQDIIME